MGWSEILFPFLIVCGFLGLVLLVGVGFSYLWLVWLNKQATTCPKCGEKGAGKLVESKVIDSKTHLEGAAELPFDEEGAAELPFDKEGAGQQSCTQPRSHALPSNEEWRTHAGGLRQDAKAVRVIEETYEDHFECQRCGYRWTKNAQWTRSVPTEKQSLR
jgi:hypothetical protein